LVWTNRLCGGDLESKVEQMFPADFQGRRGCFPARCLSGVAREVVSVSPHYSRELGVACSRENASYPASEFRIYVVAM